MIQTNHKNCSIRLGNHKEASRIFRNVDEKTTGELQKKTGKMFTDLLEPVEVVAVLEPSGIVAISWNNCALHVLYYYFSLLELKLLYPK